MEARTPGANGGCPAEPACDDVDALTSALCVAPCDVRCATSTSRFSLWVTQYDVWRTLGYGEHQGLGLIGMRYTYDTRASAGAGMAAPWRHDDGALWAQGDEVEPARQLEMRTRNPGGETADAVPISLPADGTSGRADIDRFALCSVESILDERLYNHGRTLAESVPQDDGDAFYRDRALIPLRLLSSFEVTTPAAALEPADEAARCLGVIEDGYCDAVCGNCSYSADLNNPNADWVDVAQPGGQLPTPAQPTGGSPPPAYCPEDEATTTIESQRLCGRSPWSTLEDGHEVFYVGGSIWGPGDDPEQDGVAWMSWADGAWPDPFTHCYDPNGAHPQQTPFGSVFVGPGRMITGKWGHNSNSDAEAALRHFLGCAADPVTAAEPAWFNADADGSPCTACGHPRDVDAEPTQWPCVDATQTASLGWGYDTWTDARGIGATVTTVGAHDVADFDLGKYDGTDRSDPGFGPAETWADLPKPICRTSGEPVYGM
jgi:hypothetical protein